MNDYLIIACAFVTMLAIAGLCILAPWLLFSMVSLKNKLEQSNVQGVFKRRDKDLGHGRYLDVFWFLNKGKFDSLADEALIKACATTNRLKWCYFFLLLVYLMMFFYFARL